MRVKEIQGAHLFVLSKEDGKLLELLVGELDVLMQGLPRNVVFFKGFESSVRCMNYYVDFSILRLTKDSLECTQR